MQEFIEDKRHPYEYAVDLSSDSAPARVIRMTGRAKRVLEIGAGPGSITRHLRHACDCRVTALELDHAAIMKLSPFCERVYQANLNESSWIDLLRNEGAFDVVVAADVLEHLNNPLAVLRQMAGFVGNDGCVIISLPHVGHAAVHACMLDEDFEYRDWGLLDRTHIRFFGIRNIQSLFEHAGLKIVRAEFVTVAPEQTEFADKWRKLAPNVRKTLVENPFGTVYQVVVKAVPASAPGEAISLMSLPVAPAKSSILAEAIKRVLRPLLSHDRRVRLRSLLRKLGG